MNKLARVLKAALTGTVSPEVLAQREKEDRDAGVIRLTDENYDSLVAEGDPSILWVVLVWVLASSPPDEYARYRC